MLPHISALIFYKLLSPDCPVFNSELQDGKYHQFLDGKDSYIIERYDRGKGLGRSFTNVL
jgi:hypothetical protein